MYAAFPMLHHAFLPAEPLRPLSLTHASYHPWIEKRFTMTADSFRTMVDGFWGRPNGFLCGEAQVRIEEVFQELVAAGTPAQGSAEWARIVAGPTDEEWADRLATWATERAAALVEAKEDAVSRSVEFGALPVRRIAAYYEEIPNHEIWEAITSLAPHRKIRKAMEYAITKLQEEGTHPPPGYTPCFCVECLMEWTHPECSDPHCCAQLSASEIADMQEEDDDDY